MSTYIFMKILESAPKRYDKGIRILALGKLEEAYHRLISSVEKRDRVLDIGCGTGTLTLMAAERRAHVRGIDMSAEMLQVAKEKTEKAHLSEKVEFSEKGVAELGAEVGESYNVAMSSLCFSELSEDELNFTLKEVMRILKSEGFFLVADEVKPEGIFKRIINFTMRIPLVIITYVITQKTEGGMK